MIIYNEKDELMDIPNYFDIVKRGYCCIESKQLFQFKKCPLCSFDEEGKICKPYQCEDFVKLY